MIIKKSNWIEALLLVSLFWVLSCANPMNSESVTIDFGKFTLETPIELKAEQRVGPDDAPYVAYQNDKNLAVVYDSVEYDCETYYSILAESKSVSNLSKKEVLISDVSADWIEFVGNGNVIARHTGAFFYKVYGEKHLFVLISTYDEEYTRIGRDIIKSIKFK